MKTSMKRWLGAVLSGALLLGIVGLAGCSGNNVRKVKLDPKNPVTVTVWHYYNGPQKEAFDRQLIQFNETVGMEQGIIVEGISQGNVTDLTGKVMDSANKKVGAAEIPEMFATYADTAYALDKMGLIAALDPYLSKEEISEYIDSYMDEGRFDKENSLKIFPIAKSTEVLMLNKTDWDKFAAATGAKLSELATMEGITKTAKAYYEWTDAATSTPEDGKAFFGRDAMANYFIVGMKQLGVTLLDVNDGTVTFRLDKQALRKLWDNYYVPFINGYFAAEGKFRTDDAKTGDVIALVGSTSGASYFPSKVTLPSNNTYAVEPLVLPCPVFEGGSKIAVQQGAGIAVAKSTPEKEYASVVFLKWFTEKERNVEFSASSGYLPVRKDANDIALIQSELGKMEESATKTNLSKVLPVAVESTKDYTFYTNKVYDNASAVRNNVLETSMSELAKKDRSQVRAQMAKGVSRKQAVAQFDNDAHFEEWFQQFSSDLSAELNAK